MKTADVAEMEKAVKHTIRKYQEQIDTSKNMADNVSKEMLTRTK